MEISWYHRQVARSGSAGNVIASPSNSYEESERLGNVMTEEGFAGEKQRLQAEYHDQINSAGLAIDKLFMDFENNLDPDNTDKWLDNVDNMQGSAYDKVAEKITNERAKAHFSAMLEEKKLRQKKSVSDYRRVVDTRNYQRNYYANYQVSQEIAAKQNSPGGYVNSVDDHLESTYGLRRKEGAAGVAIDDYETIEDYANPAYHTEELRMSEARRWLAGTANLYDAGQKEKIRQWAMANPDLMDENGNVTEKDYWPNHLNELAGRPLFTPDEQDAASGNYRTKKNAIDRLAKLQLEAEQDKNNRDAWVKIRRGELTDPMVIENMVLSEDLTIESGKALVKLMGEGPATKNDDEALMRAHEIEEKVRRGEMTAREAFKEIQPLMDKLTDTTYDGIVAALPKLGTQPEHVKTYFDMLNTWRTAGNQLEDNLLGDTELEQAKNYNKYHKALSDWSERNPEATIDQVAAAFRKLVGEPEAKRWFLKSVGRFFTPPPIHAARLIAKKRELDRAETIKDKANLLYSYVIFNPNTGEYMGRNSKEEQWKKVK